MKNLDNVTKKILVWLPLPEGMSWRGEGISQTIEKIIINSSANIEYDIYTAKSIGAEILESMDDQEILCKFRFINEVSKNKKIKKNKVEFDNSRFSFYKLLVERLDGHWKKIQKYRVLLVSLISIKNVDHLIDKYDAVWVPTPVVKLNCKSRKSKIFYNFWDPFVFEYSFFGYLTKYFFYRRFAFIKSKGYKIITQSEFNKKYLSDVLGFNSDLINIARLGGPDDKGLRNINYSKFNFSEYPLIIDDGRVKLAKFISEMDNRSALFRAISRFKKETKIIFVTTQNRPYKGLYQFLEIYKNILMRNDVFLITTADINQLIIESFPELSESVCILKRVSNKQHEYLMRNSDLIIHPSYVEGGQGAFSMFEAALMNKPSIINWGRHVEEFKKFHPGVEDLIGKFSVDFDKVSSVEQLIHDLLFDNVKIKDNIEIVRGLVYSWTDSATRYEEIFSK
jgi:hypothetical protein